MGVATSHFSDDENTPEAVSPLKPQSSVPDDVKKYVEERIGILKLELLDNQRKYKSSKSEIVKLKAEYDELAERHTKLIKEHNELVQTGVQVQKVVSKISEKAVDDYVESILSDPAVQHGYITEAIEGVVYKKALKVVLHAIAKAADSAHLQFIGHKVTFAIEPSETDSTRNSETPKELIPCVEQPEPILTEAELIQEMLKPEKEKEEVCE